VGDSQQKWEADYYVVICPIGYHDYQPEYILALTQGALSTTDQTWLIDQAKLLSQHLQLCQAYQLKTTEIHCLEQVLHRVGHQLKNPLALVGLYAENLYRSLAQTSLRQQADLIRTTVQNLADHLTDLLYCSRAGQLQRSRQDLRQLIRASVVDLDFWIREKHLHISYPQEALWGWVDPLQIKQVFDNLLSNAVHFSPFQGIIDLQWHCFQQEILIQIQDQGPGLPAEDCQKIFKPFYSQREGGTGLGLTIARKVMLDHHGNLWAENLPQGGAQFSLVLPDRCPTGFMQD
jgi:signal transduction histidine kinase